MKKNLLGWAITAIIFDDLQKPEFIRAPEITTSITEAANRKKPKAQWKREQKRKWV